MKIPAYEFLVGLIYGCCYCIIAIISPFAAFVGGIPLGIFIYMYLVNTHNSSSANVSKGGGL